MAGSGLYCNNNILFGLLFCNVFLCGLAYSTQIITVLCGHWTGRHWIAHWSTHYTCVLVNVAIHSDTIVLKDVQNSNVM